ncbi:MAG: cytidylate kinase family protein [Candidatus Altiarchaeota archaeon]|nr:cytidylate kinase family protein [Candidatus Altiarchaeota archaeon]
MIVTVGGQAASGKSTLAKSLADRLSFKHLSAGKLMREMAEEKGMSLLDFSIYAETHPEIDKNIDEKQKSLAKGDCIVDGRLSRFFLNPEVSIWLVAPSKIRGERALGRGEKYKTLDEAEAAILKRDVSERKRYVDYYDIDLEDLSCYDLVLNTGRFNIKQMTEIAYLAVDSLRSIK